MQSLIHNNAKGEHAVLAKRGPLGVAIDAPEDFCVVSGKGLHIAKFHARENVLVEVVCKLGAGPIDRDSEGSGGCNLQAELNNSSGQRHLHKETLHWVRGVRGQENRSDGYETVNVPENYALNAVEGQDLEGWQGRVRWNCAFQLRY